MVIATEPPSETLNKLKLKFCQGVSVGGRVLTCPPLTYAWVLHGISWEDVRHVYRRATWIHCPSKPKLLMQWAEFEESQGKNLMLLYTVVLQIFVQFGFFLFYDK